jgi:hypothetical protein
LSFYFIPLLKFKGVSLIRSALNKYGLAYFSLLVIIIPEATKEKVLALEQYLIDSYNPEYNILQVAGSVAGRQYSEEYKNNMRKLLGTAVFVYSEEGVLLQTFDSQKQAANSLSASEGTIKLYLDQDSLFRGYFRLTSELVELSNLTPTLSEEEFSALALAKKKLLLKMVN